MRKRSKRITAAVLALLIATSMSGTSIYADVATGGETPPASSGDVPGVNENEADPGKGENSGGKPDTGNDGTGGDSGDTSGNTGEPGGGDTSGNTDEPGAGGDNSGNTDEPGTGGDNSGNTDEPGTGGDTSGNTDEPGTGGSEQPGGGDTEGSGGEKQCACGTLPDENGVTLHEEGCPLYEAPAPEEAECVCTEKCGETPNPDCPVCKDDGGKCAFLGQIVSVTALTEEQSKITVTPGTAKEAIPFPATVKAMTKAGAEEEAAETEVPVKWDCALYDANTNGDYVFTATAPGYTLAEGVTMPEITVTVAETVTIFFEESYPTRSVGGAEDVEALSGFSRNFSGTWSGSGFKDQLGAEAKGFYTKIYSALQSGLGDTQHPFTAQNNLIQLSETTKTISNVTIVPQKDANGKWKVKPQPDGSYYPDYAVVNDEYDQTRAAWSEAAQCALDALTYDHPEIFWLKLGKNGGSQTVFSMSIVGNMPKMNADGTPKDGATVENITDAQISFDMLLKGVGNGFGSLAELQTEISSAKAAIQQKIANNSSAYPATPYGKLKAVHDYVCETLTYDTGNVNAPVNQTVWSAFKNKKTVCAGYAKMFKLLCDYPCVLVAGWGTNGSTSEAHMWNYVQIGSAWYAVDTTWDDQTSGTLYDFFLTGGNEKGQHFNETTFLESHVPNGKLSGVESISFGYPDLSLTKCDPSVSGTVATVTIDNGNAVECADWAAVLAAIGDTSGSVTVTLLENAAVTAWPTKAITLKVTKGKTLASSSAPTAGVTLELIDSEGNSVSAGNGVKILTGTDVTTNFTAPSGAVMVGSKDAVYVAPDSYKVMVEPTNGDTKFYDNWAGSTIIGGSTVSLKDGASAGPVTCPNFSFTLQSADSSPKALTFSGGGAQNTTVELNNIALTLGGDVKPKVVFTNGSKLTVAGGTTYKLGGIGGENIPLTVTDSADNTKIEAPGMSDTTFVYSVEGHETKRKDNTFEIRVEQSTTLAFTATENPVYGKDDIVLTVTGLPAAVTRAAGNNQVIFSYKKGGTGAENPLPDGVTSLNPSPNNNGTATVTIPKGTLDAGTYGVYASYDGTFGSKKAFAAKKVEVKPAAPTLTLASNREQQIKGRAIELTATLTYPVALKAGETAPTSIIVNVAGGTPATATLSQSSSSGTTYTYKGNFTGDTVQSYTFDATVAAAGNFAEAAAEQITVEFVDKYKPTIELSASPSGDLVAGNKLTLTATVAKPLGISESDPTGKVVFSDGKSSTPVEKPLTSGQKTAVYEIAPVAAGSYSYTAQYVPDGGDPVYQQSDASASVSVVVRPAKPSADKVAVDYATEKITFAADYEVTSDPSDWTGKKIASGGSIDTLLGQSIYVREKENTVASIPASDHTEIRLAGRPAAPVITIDYTAEKTKQSVPAEVEYSTDGTTFTDGPGAVIPLDAGTAYTFRMKATAAKPHGVEITLKPVRAATPEKPVMTAHTDTTITLKTVAGGRYGKKKASAVTNTEDDFQWQTSPVFTGLDAKTEYTFAVQLTATSDKYKSEVSDAAAFSTEQGTLKAAKDMTVSAVYGTSLSMMENMLDAEVSYNGTKVEGNWSWAADPTPGSTYPKPGDPRTYKAVFQPTRNGDAYKRLEAEVKTNMTRAALSIDTAEVANKVYDGKTDAVCSELIFSGMAAGDTSDAIKGLADIKAAFASANAGNPVAATVTVTLGGVYADYYTLANATATANAEITKAETTVSPAFATVNIKTSGEHQDFSYDLSAFKLNVPSGMSAGNVTYAVSGQNDSVLQQSMVEVKGKLLTAIAKDNVSAGTTETLKITVSSDNFTAPAEVELIIKVVDKDIPKPKGPVSYTGTLTYGDQLDKLKLVNPGFVFDGKPVEGDLIWDSGTQLLDAGDRSVTWVFNPTDGLNYAQVTGTLDVTVAQKPGTDHPDYAVPTPGPVMYGLANTLADVTLDPGWEWVTPSEIPTVAKTVYKANFKPGKLTQPDLNYADVLNVDVELTVNKALAVFPTVGTLEVVLNDVSGLSEVALPILPDGKLVWKGDAALQSGQHGYEAVFVPTDPNYNSAAGTIQVKATAYTATIAQDGGTLTDSTLTLTAPNTAKLKYTDTTASGGAYEFLWASSNSSIAKVEQDGTITAVKPGVATIRLDVAINGKTAKIPAGTVLVKVKANDGDTDPKIQNAEEAKNVAAGLAGAPDEVVKDIAGQVANDMQETERKKLDKETVKDLDMALDKALNQVSPQVQPTPSTNLPVSCQIDGNLVSANGLVLAAYQNSGVQSNTNNTKVTLVVKQQEPGSDNVLMTFDIKLYAGTNGGTGDTLISNPATPVTIRIPFPEGIDPTKWDKTVEHGAEKISATLNGTIAEFTTTSFSTFTFNKKKAPAPSPDGSSGNTGGGSGGGSSGGGSSASGESIFGFRTGELDFWNNVRAAVKKAKAGDLININAKGYDRVPSTLLTAVFGKDVTLRISWKDGGDIVIYGKSAIRPEENRIYYPLSLLAELYAEERAERALPEAEEALTETAGVVPPSAGGSYTGIQAGPSKGGVWNLEAPDGAALGAKPTAKEQGVATPEQMSLLESDPTLLERGEEAAGSAVHGPEKSAGSGFLALGAVLVALAAAGAVLMVRRRRQK